MALVRWGGGVSEVGAGWRRPRGRVAEWWEGGARRLGEGALVPDPDRDEERRDVGSGRSGLGFGVPWGLVGEVGWAGPAGPACS